MYVWTKQTKTNTVGWRFKNQTWHMTSNEYLETVSIINICIWCHIVKCDVIVNSYERDRRRTCWMDWNKTLGVHLLQHDAISCLGYDVKFRYHFMTLERSWSIHPICTSFFDQVCFFWHWHSVFSLSLSLSLCPFFLLKQSFAQGM